ncbi:hypothetical protein DBR11_05855 [Pedobacter sp. HMWF019]|uniref:hypothetical protein n=1 Tax=Pedobacter sp. HMWF019 TaxID=2056856 RepID=UPI000D344543|nr:hypothetical protein [Pedobacter sp. HMWF019]PTT02066.1 hypothetical protein DBR11_05855 [Pedobacter sp. HMWF019]
MSIFEGDNPLYGVTIGGTIYAVNGKINPSVVKGSVSLMISQEKSVKYMSGESSCFFSEKMNQGSFGLSGAYGVSGVSLLKSSLSAYVGKSSAASSKSVAVNYNAISLGGIEYINFEQLTASQFMNSLNAACEQSITSVLNAYNAVMAKVSKSDSGLLSVFYNDDVQSKELKALVSKWIKASEQFTRDFGDGLVVGVAWGAFGGVKMVMTSESESRSWKYGGQTDFSYAGPLASAAVKATYDGSQSSAKAKVMVNCTSYLSGSVLSSQIKEWFDQVANKTFADLADVNVLDRAPSMNITHGAPSIPEFVQPVPEEDIVKKVEEIKNLDGLDTMAKASAYEKTKITNPKLTFDEFINKADKPAKKEKLDEFKKKIINNEVDTLGCFNEQKNKAAKIEEKYEDLAKGSGDGSFSPEAAAFNADVKTEGYVPLGVWISNWSDLFPWMAQGYYNSIDGIEGEDIVKARVMLQDYQTLSRMYYIAHSSGITEFKRKDSSKPIVTSLSIADAFANAAGKVQGISENFKETEMENIYENLGEAAQNIYKLWNKVAFLRNCELGLGLIKDNKTIGDPLKNADKNNDGTRQTYALSTCDFDGKNYTVFSRCYKVLPLLTPDEDIWIFGPEQGGLSSIYNKEIVFSKPGRAKYLVFEYIKEKKILSNSDNGIKLYPIPFSAAQNVSAWKGMSFSTNIGSVKSLNDRLKSLSDDLGKLNAWSFSSANWDKSWSGKDFYRQRNIKKQYIGLIDKIETVF